MRSGPISVVLSIGRLAAFWGLVVLLNLALAWGAREVAFDDGLAQVFQSTSPQYSDYKAYLENFDANEGDLLMVFTGRDFASPEAWRAVHEFVLEVQFEPEVAGLVSPFSFDLPTPESGDVAAAMDRLWQENPAFRRVVSRDRQVLAVMLMTGDAGPAAGTLPLSHRLQALADETVAGTGITARLTGYPVLRDKVVEAIFGDFVLNAALGIAIGTLVSVVALRSFALALMATVTSATALLWMLGLFGFAGLRINVLTISLPVLILVLSFSSAIHLTLEVRRRAEEGDRRAVSNAVRRIGPACLLTTITTAVAFASLMTSPSTLIADMGLAGVVATLASLLAVFIMHPLLLLSAARWPGLVRVFAGNRGRAMSGWSLGWMQKWGARYSGAVSLGAVLLLLAGVVAYLRVEPVYSLYDNVATDSDAYQALQVAERALAPIGAVVFPTSFSLEAPDGMERLGAATAVLQEHAPGVEVVSLASFQGSDAAQPLPAPFRARLLAHDGKTPLIMLLVPNQGAVAVRAFLERLVAGLDADPDWPADQVGAPTGLLAASAFLSRDMLLDLNRCFLVAVIVSGLVIGVWLRNPVLGLIALIPNVLPVALVGAWLALSGAGLEFSSGIALTIAFGLAIDDTIHVLNRMRLDARPGQAVAPALVMSALKKVAPALVITSGVLSFGLIGTQFGQLSMISYFGRLLIAAFVLALVADLLVFPALLITAARLLPARVLRIGR